MFSQHDMQHAQNGECNDDSDRMASSAIQPAARLATVMPICVRQVVADLIDDNDRVLGRIDGVPGQFLQAGPAHSHDSIKISFRKAATRAERRI